jgi:hypothetical protein
MLLLSLAEGLGTLLFIALLAGCSRQPDEGDPGSATEALAGAYCITDVVIDPITYHFDSPRWLLDSSEGAGPRVLGVIIAGLAQPLVSTNMSEHPHGSDISRAVGYNLGQYYFVQASALRTVNDGAYERLEAYTNYARSAWVIRDAACGAVLGAGVSFKPIGIHFEVRKAGNVPIDGVNVFGVFPDCAGGQCGYAPPPPDDAPKGMGAGDGDAGAGDASVGDAGGQ